MSLRRLVEAFTVGAKSGYANPQAAFVYETPSVALSEVMKLYERDPTCKASVDLLAASAVGSGFYTTVNDDYEKAAQAKTAIDEFNENVNLDALLCDMAKSLIACGNDFWLKLAPQKTTALYRLPTDAVERIHQGYLEEKTLKIPYKTQSYKLRHAYGAENLSETRWFTGALTAKAPLALARVCCRFCCIRWRSNRTGDLRLHL